MAQAKIQDGDSAAEQAAERVRELNERIIEASRRAGESYLDVYERTLSALADFQLKVGEKSQVAFIEGLAKLQATFIREITRAYTKTMRDLLK